MMGKFSLLFCALCVIDLSQTSPQYYPLPNPGQPQFSPFSGPQPWQNAYRTNFSNPNPLPNPNPNQYYYPNPNPNPQGYSDPLSAEDFNRQLYGVPPPPQGSGFPQIYKIDNLIIIANPTQQQPQPCIPQSRPPPTRTPDAVEEDILNRRPSDNGEPSDCTWAIVACCSPNNAQVRYSCFELLNCRGFFFDDSACSPKLVMAAANAAQEFYRSSANRESTTNSTSTDSGSINNRV